MFKNTHILGMIVGAVVAFIVPLSKAGILYQEDFSSGAPGWVFNSPNFYWDATNQRLAIESLPDWSGSAYVPVPTPTGSFQLSWTFGIIDFPFVSGCNPALSSSIDWPKQNGYDSAPPETLRESIVMGFNSDDWNGNNAHVWAYNGSNVVFDNNHRSKYLSPAGKIYDFVAEYDASNFLLHSSIKENGVLIGSWTDPFVASGNMSYIMINQNRTVTGWLDNIVLTPEPATLSLLALGGLALLRKRRFC